MIAVSVRATAKMVRLPQLRFSPLALPRVLRWYSLITLLRACRSISHSDASLRSIVRVEPRLFGAKRAADFPASLHRALRAILPALPTVLPALHTASRITPAFLLTFLRGSGE